MRRREFIAFLGTALVWPLAARAQANRPRRIGVLMTSAENDPEGRTRAAAFNDGLQQLGWAEGQNLKIEWRWAGGDVERIRRQAAELVGIAPDVIVANGSTILGALKQATSSIPIVFAIVNDPVGQGFIANLARPGGNITGFTFVESPMLGKSLELLKQVSPNLARVAFMFNPATYPYQDRFLPAFRAEAQRYQVEVTEAPVRTVSEIDAAIAQLAAQPGGGLMVPPDTYTLVHREPIAKAAAHHRIPAIYSYRQLVKEGGLMSYGPDSADIFRRAASYVDRILKGATAADLPAQAPNKFELAINLKTATTLGLEIPAALLALADEVIE